MARARKPPQSATELFEHKWTCAILRALLDGELRFSELRAKICGISETALTDRLKELVDLGFVSRRFIDEWRRGTAYRLIGPVEELRLTFEAMARWYAAVVESEL